jgi:outer membrane protein OmpA-like peptidoglycan-associated protein
MKKKFLLSTSCLALIGAMTLSSGMAHAQQEMGTLSYYSIPESEVRDHSHEWAVFMEYQMHREQCQHYQAAPAGYVMKGCNLYREDSVKAVEATTRTETVTEIAEPAVVSQAAAISAYTIHFGFDKSNIPDSEKAALGHAAQEIKKYNPSAVTVSGYASTPGSDDYNQILSEKRAQTVAHALVDEGISNEIINQAAYGEANLAVPTPDNTRMPPNRRVVIQFNH